MNRIQFSALISYNSAHNVGPDYRERIKTASMVFFSDCEASAAHYALNRVDYPEAKLIALVPGGRAQ
jgi:hypothetical protein